MKKKTTENAVNTISKIKNRIQSDVIKEFELPALRVVKGGRNIGFAVVLTLSTKYQYYSNILDYWKQQLEADRYIISVYHNRLKVIFKVYYEEDNV